MVTRYQVGDAVRITEATLKIMKDSNRSCVTPNCPSDDFLAKAAACVGVEGVVTHTFPPGYEVSAKFGEQSFHMKDHWITKAELAAAPEAGEAHVEHKVKKPASGASKLSM